MHVGFAEDDGARVAQPRDDECVIGRLMTGERQRPTACRHGGGVEIVLEDDRDAVHRSAHATLASLAVESPCLGPRSGIEPDHRVECRSAGVVCSDSGQICVHKFKGAGLPLRHGTL